MRLIDADALMKEFIKFVKDSNNSDFADVPTWNDAVSLVGSAPTIETERKKGRWVWNENGMDWGLGAWVCSVCRSKPETWWESDKKNNPLRCSGSHFCGNCGADMREEK